MSVENLERWSKELQERTTELRNRFLALSKYLNDLGLDIETGVKLDGRHTLAFIPEPWRLAIGIRAHPDHPIGAWHSIEICERDLLILAAPKVPELLANLHRVADKQLTSLSEILSKDLWKF